MKKNEIIEQDPTITNCPYCGKNDGCLEVGTEDRFFKCDEHKLTWVRRDWEERVKQWKANAQTLSRYSRIAIIPFQMPEATDW